MTGTIEARTLGPYVLGAPLGAGSMGQVFRARDTRAPGAEVALKIIPPELAADPSRVRRFEQEARAAARVEHPNVLRLVEVGEAGGTRYIVSELLEGRTLKARLESGPLGRVELMELAIALADGLAALHAAGVVHRDLKPENLFVLTGGGLKILDLGLARLTGPGGGDGTGTLSDAGTSPGTILGTAGYMAPEQVRGVAVEAPSDLFAAGAILYEMACGRRAFPGDTAIDRALAILRDEPPPLDRAGLPMGLEPLIRRCLVKDPAARTLTAQELAGGLRGIEDDQGTMETDLRLSTVPRSPRPPRPWLWPLSWAVSVAIAVVATAWVTRSPEARTERRVMVAELVVPTGEPPFAPPAEPAEAASAADVADAAEAQRAAAEASRAASGPPEPPHPAGPAEPHAPEPPRPGPHDVPAPEPPCEGPQCDEAAFLDGHFEADTATDAERLLGAVGTILKAKLKEAAAEFTARELERRRLGAPPQPPIPPQIHARLTVAGDGREVKLECRSRREGALVAGQNHVVEVTGPCGFVTINGRNHNVTVESTTVLVVAGQNHNVRYSVADDDEPPEIFQSGANHSVEPE